MQTPQTSGPQTWKTFVADYLEALKHYYHTAKIIIYSLLLVLALTAGLLRKQFPELKPYWPTIGNVIIAILLGILFLPPIVKVLRTHKKTDPREYGPHS